MATRNYRRLNKSDILQAFRMGYAIAIRYQGQQLAVIPRVWSAGKIQAEVYWAPEGSPYTEGQTLLIPRERAYTALGQPDECRAERETRELRKSFHELKHSRPADQQMTVPHVGLMVWAGWVTSAHTNAADTTRNPARYPSPEARNREYWNVALASLRMFADAGLDPIPQDAYQGA